MKPLVFWTLFCAASCLPDMQVPVVLGHDSQAEPRSWPLVRRLPSADATQAAAADARYLYAVSNKRVVVYDRQSEQQVMISEGYAMHLNSAFVHDQRVFCAHSNYPRQPEQSEIRVFDPETGKLEIFHDFGESEGSLTWAIFDRGHWWCHFAFYGAENSRSYLAKFDAEWQELDRWTIPEAVVRQLGKYSLSGGVWHGEDLLVTGHDDPILFRLQLPQEGSQLVYIGQDTAPVTGQGIAIDPTTGGLVGIQRRARQIVLTDRPQ